MILPLSTVKRPTSSIVVRLFVVVWVRAGYFGLVNRVVVGPPLALRADRFDALRGPILAGRRTGLDADRVLREEGADALLELAFLTHRDVFLPNLEARRHDCPPTVGVTPSPPTRTMHRH